MSVQTSADLRPVATKGSRPFRLRVAGIEHLAPHFRRITFAGEDLDIFGADGLDQRIKLLFANRRGGWVDLGWDDPAALASGEWYPRWLAAEEDERNPMRTYTVRAIDPDARELTVDFAVHDGAGPGGSFPDTATLGQELVAIGPDSRSPLCGQGIDFHPGTARRLLLAGDETAVPAICGILEKLAGRAEELRDVHAFMEVPSADDPLPMDLPEGFHVTWLARDLPTGAPVQNSPIGDRLVDAVRGFARQYPRPAAERRQQLEDVDVDRDLLWEVPSDDGTDFYAWIAGEAGVVKTLRRILVAEHGIDRGQVAFMGYWRQGKAEN